MKTQLTKEQSTHLIELSVPKEKASRILHIQLTDICGNPIDDDYKNTFTWKYEGKKPFMPFIDRSSVKYISYDIFTLSDLLEILPKTLSCEYFPICPLQMVYHYHGKNTWSVTYDDFESLDYFESEELIDALYELACWYYGKFLKSEYIKCKTDVEYFKKHYIIVKEK